MKQKENPFRLLHLISFALRVADIYSTPGVVQANTMQERVEELDANVPANQPINEANARPMTYDEKRRLSCNINRLAGPSLEEVIKIIRKREPNPTGNPDEVEIDFEKLQPVTLRELEAFTFSILGESYNDDFDTEDDSFSDDESEMEGVVENVSGHLADVDITDNGLSQV